MKVFKADRLKDLKEELELEEEIILEAMNLPNRPTSPKCLSKLLDETLTIQRKVLDMKITAIDRLLEVEKSIGRFSR